MIKRTLNAAVAALALLNWQPAGSAFAASLAPLTDVTGKSVTLLDGTSKTVDSALDDAAAGWRIVAARTGNGGGAGTNATNYQTMGRMPNPVPAGATALKYCFGGWGNIAPNIVAPNSNYVATSVTVSGGSGYQAGDIVVMATPVAGNVPIKVRIPSVTSGAPTSAALEDPGVYGTPLAPGASQASTTNGAGNAAGTGATFTFTWKAYATQVHVGVEPAGSNQATTGPLAIRQATGGPTKPSGTFQSGNEFDTPNIDILVPSGGIACSDPIPLNVAPGDVLQTRLWTSGIGTGFARYIMPGEYFGQALPATDYSASGTLTASASNSGTAGATSAVGSFAPLMILGLPKKYVPSFGLMTDSIGFGSTCATAGLCSGQLSVDPGACDSSGIVCYKGPYERALMGNYAWMHLGHPSDALAYKFNATSGRDLDYKAIDLARPSNVLVALSINDFNLQGQTAAQVLANEQRMASELHGKPSVKRVFGVTTTPQTTNATSSPLVANTTSCPQVQIRNPSMRIGLTSTGAYAAPASFTATTAVGSTGSATITPDAMAKTVGGATFTNVQQGVMVYDTGANQETVSITSTGTTTVTGTFTKTHAAGVPYTLQSPYYGYYDAVIDVAATLMSSISPVDSCIWGNAANTADGTHFSGSPGEAVAASIVLPIIQANAK